MKLSPRFNPRGKLLNVLGQAHAYDWEDFHDALTEMGWEDPDNGGSCVIDPSGKVVIKVSSDSCVGQHILGSVLIN